MNTKLIKFIKILGCFAVAGIVLFVAIPYNNQDNYIEVVRINQDVKKGELIVNRMLVVDKEVSNRNVSNDTLKDMSDVLGTYATQDLYKGDFINKFEITNDLSEIDSNFYSKQEDKFYIAVTAKSLSSTVGTYLKPGDIVAVSYSDEDSGEVHEYLKYVKLVALTNAFGVEVKDSVDENALKENIPSMAVLEVNERQLEVLTLLEYNYSLHLSFVYRGTEERRHEFLSLQESIIGDNNGINKN